MSDSHNETVLQVPIFSDLANLAMALRREVFVLEQGVPESEEYDAYDLTADQYVMVVDGDVIATLRVIQREGFSQVSRFVVRVTHRGQGVGGRLLDHVLRDLVAQGKPKTYLSAQADKMGFYEKYGFQAYGDEYTECDIVHRHMKNWEENQ